MGTSYANLEREGILHKVTHPIHHHSSSMAQSIGRLLPRLLRVLGPALRLALGADGGVPVDQLLAGSARLNSAQNI